MGDAGSGRDATRVDAHRPDGPPQQPLESPSAHDGSISSPTAAPLLCSLPRARRMRGAQRDASGPRNTQSVAAAEWLPHWLAPAPRWPQQQQGAVECDCGAAVGSPRPAAAAAAARASSPQHARLSRCSGLCQQWRRQAARLGQQRAGPGESSAPKRASRKRPSGTLSSRRCTTSCCARCVCTSSARALLKQSRPGFLGSTELASSRRSGADRGAQEDSAGSAHQAGPPGSSRARPAAEGEARTNPGFLSTESREQLCGPGSSRHWRVPPAR